MGYHRIRYRVEREQSEPLCQALEQCDALAVTIEGADTAPHFDQAGPVDPEWDAVYVTGLFADSMDPQTIHRQVCALESAPRLPDRMPNIEHLPEQDWEQASLRQFQPLHIAPRLWVCPSWITPPDPGAVNIVLDPGLAFGTGSHATTALCLRWLADATLAGKKVVDYGCGSGILAVAALQLGADQVIAVDIDPRARTATRTNAAANQIAGPRLRVLSPEQVPTGLHADVIVVNILANVIVEHAPLLDRMLAADGTILLTGILEPQVDQVRAAYTPAFEFTVTQREEWCLLVGRRRAGVRHPGAQ